jgi:hypothetical protein
MLCGVFAYAGLRKKNVFIQHIAASQSLQTLVPKRYAKQETTVDSAGNPHQVYRYGNGAFLYFIHTTDTATLFHPIDTAVNIPLPHPLRRVMYKGLDSAGVIGARSAPIRSGSATVCARGGRTPL